jgi:hypothetical protein
MNPTALRQAAKHLAPSRLRQHPLFQDPVSVTVLGATVACNVVTLLLLIVKVRQVPYPVPVHYLSLVGFDQTASWFQVYRFVVFGLAVTAINGFLAAKSFQRHRLTSFFLLLGGAVVSLLCLVVSVAFAVIV